MSHFAPPAAGYQPSAVRNHAPGREVVTFLALVFAASIGVAVGLPRSAAAQLVSAFIPLAVLALLTPFGGPVCVPGDLRQQADQLPGLGGRRPGPAADGRAVRLGPDLDARGLVPGRLEVPPPFLLALRHLDAVRDVLQRRAGRCTTHPTSPPTATTAPPTAASTSATSAASKPSSPQPIFATKSSSTAEVSSLKSGLSTVRL
jgi:hypothetical protein